MVTSKSRQPDTTKPTIPSAAMQYCAEGKYKDAFRAASQAIAEEPSNIEGYIALSETALHLRAFDDAVLALKGWEAHPRARPYIQKARNCYEEHATGNYNLSKMYQEAVKDPRMMHGDYINPKVALETRNDLRGIFAQV
jgi:thioredoxin-like negative regulator of GroEL